MGNLSKHFSRSEFSCKCGCGFDTVDAELISILEDLRDHFNRPVRVNSACRCNEHNNHVGGAKNSQHLIGRAADITVDDISPMGVYVYLSEKYTDKYGIGRYAGFTHLDSRTTRSRW